MERFEEFETVWEGFEAINNIPRLSEDGTKVIRFGGNEQNLEVNASNDEQETNRNDASSSSRRRQKYRHTPYQIQELETFFKNNPHPDEKERAAIGRKLNLEASQVKFWFQNRRTQFKAQTERHDNTILKKENERLRLETMAMKDAMRNRACNNCGGPVVPVNRPIKESLRIENAWLKEELNRVTNIARQVLSYPEYHLN